MLLGNALFAARGNELRDAEADAELGQFSTSRCCWLYASCDMTQLRGKGSKFDEALKPLGLGQARERYRARFTSFELVGLRHHWLGLSGLLLISHWFSNEELEDNSFVEER